MWRTAQLLAGVGDTGDQVRTEQVGFSPVISLHPCLFGAALEMLLDLKPIFSERNIETLGLGDAVGASGA